MVTLGQSLSYPRTYIGGIPNPIYAAENTSSLGKIRELIETILTKCREVTPFLKLDILLGKVLWKCSVFYIIDPGLSKSIRSILEFYPPTPSFANATRYNECNCGRNIENTSKNNQPIVLPIVVLLNSSRNRESDEGAEAD